MSSGDHDTEHLIHDKHGAEYRIVESPRETYIRFKVLNQRVMVAYVNCGMRGEVLRIIDLFVASSAVHKPWFHWDLFFFALSFPPVKRRTVNYQDRGIGTAMIRFLVDYARSNSAKRIEGDVKHHDYKNNQDLPAWYRRRGFTVVMNDGTGVGIAKISMEV